MISPNSNEYITNLLFSFIEINTITVRFSRRCVFFVCVLQHVAHLNTFSGVLADTPSAVAHIAEITNTLFAIWCLTLNLCIFAAESSSTSSDRLETIAVVAGNVVNLRCTLEASCANRSFLWTHYSAFAWPPRGITWYNGHNLNRVLVARRVNIDSDTANGRSVLTIPRARLEDGGIFHCRVSRVQHCQMKFQLIVTGKIYII